jgi:protein associated with RNAse G/E
MRPAAAVLESRKYGGLPHRVWERLWCLQEEPELVLWGPRGTPVREADGRLWNGPYPVLMFFPASRDWNAVALLQDVGPPRFYCNVCLPPVATAPGVWTYVDLDLDVIVAADLSCEVRDRDEFEANRRLLRYPAELAGRAEAGVADLLSSVRHRRGPFAPATVQAWMARAPVC